MRGMRAVLSGVLVVGGLASSCSESAAAAVPSEGALVLELGGQQESLRAGLAAAGITLGPPQRLRELPPPSVDEPPPAVGRETPAPAPEVTPGPAPAAPVAPAPESPWKVVKLKRGQTLIHLAKEHLGNGNLFRELLELNGWTEAEARRLPEGASVRVPVRARSPRGGR